MERAHTRTEWAATAGRPAVELELALAAEYCGVERNCRQSATDGVAAPDHFFVSLSHIKHPSFWLIRSTGVLCFTQSGDMLVTHLVNLSQTFSNLSLLLMYKPHQTWQTGQFGHFKHFTK